MLDMVEGCVLVGWMTVVEVKKKKFNSLHDSIMPYIAENLRPYVTWPPIWSRGDWGQSQFQLGGDDESTHQIPSNGLLFSTFYHFPYTADPLTSTAPTWPFPTIVWTFAQSPPTMPYTHHTISPVPCRTTLLMGNPVITLPRKFSSTTGKPGQRWTMPIPWRISSLNRMMLSIALEPYLLLRTSHSPIFLPVLHQQQYHHKDMQRKLNKHCHAHWHRQYLVRSHSSAQLSPLAVHLVPHNSLIQTHQSRGYQLQQVIQAAPWSVEPRKSNNLYLTPSTNHFRLPFTQTY